MFFSLSNCLVNIFLIIGVLSLSGMNIANQKSLLAEKRQEKIKKIEAEYDKRKA